MKNNTDTETIDLPIPVPIQKIKEFHVDLTKLHKIRDEYALLKIEGVKDHTGLKKVTEGRKELKTYRLNVDKRRKELNADLLVKQRLNNTAAKFIIGELLPTELYLKAQEKEIQNQKEKIRMEKKRVKMERLQKRIEQLNAFEVAFDMAEIEEMNEKEFTDLLTRSEISFQERQVIKKQNAEKFAQEQARLLEENKLLKSKLIDIASDPGLLTVPVVNIPVESFTETPVPEMQKDISQEEIDEIKLLINTYAKAVMAIPIPKIKHIPSRVIFLNGHSHIETGINLLLDASK